MRIIYNFSTPTECQRVVTKEYTTMYTIAELDPAQTPTKEEWQKTAATDLSHTVVAKMNLHNRERFDTATAAFIAKMERAGLPQLMIDTFCHYYTQLSAGESGFIGDAEAQPVAALPK
ncbi:MAG: hypothetical protein KDE31_18760, partial [Caldilineaceae bacterium]|nr:hypothetical protein [Caldilineaceae bacterium]